MSRKFPYAAIALFLFFCLILALRPLDDYDIFMQIALGRAALRNEIPLSFEPFLSSIDVAHYANPGWLWQIWAALLVDYAGLEVFRFAHVILYALALLLALYSATPITRHGLVETLALSLLPALTSTSIRPQVIAFFFFALTIYVLKKKPLNLKWTTFLTFCFLVWQNCHPSVLLALPLIALVDKDTSLFSTMTRNRIQLFALCILTAFCTPEGLDVLSLSQHNLEISREVFHVTEWLSYLELPIDFLPAFGVCALLATLLVAFASNDLNKKDIALYALFTVLTLTSVRFVVFWSLISLPLIYAALQVQRFQKLPFDLIWRFPRIVKGVLLLALFASLLYSVIQVPLLSPRLPDTCIKNVPEAALQRKVFNEPDWGGSIAYIHHRKFQVIADGRLYLRDKKWWMRFLEDLYGERDLQSILQRYSPDIFILSSKSSSGLVSQLLSSPEWENSYMSLTEDGCTIFTQPATVGGDAMLSVSETESINSSASDADSVSTSFMRSSEAPAK